ncbi:hypothetical protein BSKO_11164 [Bryopsis sp. KO-2023]|nr:hypothetical protein BSKO_11164 [Bryopsis sp. KO-2023]
MAERKVSLPISDKKVEDLLMWRDTKKSGIVFGVATLAYLILEWSGKTMLSLSAYLVLFSGLALFAWTYGAAFLHKPGPPIPAFIKEGVDEEDVKKLAAKAVPVINKGLGIFMNIISGKDLMLAAKVGGALYAIAKVANWFSFFTLGYIVVAGAFCIPKVYEMRKEEIDALLVKGLDQFKQLTSKGQTMLKKIPSAASDAAKKTE